MELISARLRSGISLLLSNILYTLMLRGTKKDKMGWINFRGRQFEVNSFYFILNLEAPQSFLFLKSHGGTSIPQYWLSLYGWLALRRILIKNNDKEAQNGDRFVYVQEGWRSG